MVTHQTCTNSNCWPFTIVCDNVLPSRWSPFFPFVFFFFFFLVENVQFWVELLHLPPPPPPPLITLGFSSFFFLSIQTGREGNIDRLMKQISTFMGEISDEFKVVVVEAIRSARSTCVKDF